MNKKILIPLIIISALILLGTNQAISSFKNKEQSPEITTKIKEIKGIASWYGPGFQGRPTASGERYDINAFTAAHRTLKFGTKVRVTNLNNDRSVIVRINDRGPFNQKRIIDLSGAAANSIGMIETGLAPVKIEILER